MKKVMVNKNYRNGRAREYRIMNKLKDKGFIVFRMSGSHGVADLIAVEKVTGAITYIQVKPTSMSLAAKNKIELENSWLNKPWSQFKVISQEKELGL